MWLVSGIDEEHRFPDWTDAATFYRQVVTDWAAAHPDRARDRAAAVRDLRPGDTHELEFAAGDLPDGPATVRFRLAWEVPGNDLGQFVAC